MFLEKNRQYIVRTYDMNSLAYYSTEGVLVHTIPKHRPVKDAELKTYYGIDQEDERYMRMTKPAAVDRYVFRKDNGHYFIIPDNRRFTFTEVTCQLQLGL